MSYYDLKWLEYQEITGNGWTWLEIARMTGYGWIYLELACDGWKLLEIA